MRFRDAEDRNRYESRGCFNVGELTCMLQCGGVIKPCITFFNEPLPEEFHDTFQSDARRADLLIV